MDASRAGPFPTMRTRDCESVAGAKPAAGAPAGPDPETPSSWPEFSPPFDEIVSFCANVGAGRRVTPEVSLRFRVSVALLPQLHRCLQNLNVSRFSYNFATGLACIEMVETPMHYRSQAGLFDLLQAARDQAVRVARGATDHDHNMAEISTRVASLYDSGTTRIINPGCGIFQPDLSLTLPGSGRLFPTIVAEIAYAQHSNDVEAKACDLMQPAVDGTRIGAVIVMDIQYSEAEHATVSLRAIAGGEPRWILYREPFFIEGAPSQPDGAIELFISDFLATYDGLPDTMKRPSSHDTRRGQATITFEDLRVVLHRAKQAQAQEDENLARLEALLLQSGSET